jgi:hypothetical protein
MRKKGVAYPFSFLQKIKKIDKKSGLTLTCLNKLMLYVPGTGIFVGSLQLCKPGLSSQHKNHRVPTHTYSSSSFPSKGGDGHCPQKFGLTWAQKNQKKKRKKGQTSDL